MLTHWEKISSEVIHKNPWWTYRLDRFNIPSGIKGEYHCVHTDGSAMVIPCTDDGKIIMINQYRFLCDKESIEFPCGGVKSGFSHKQMAYRELEEETGYYPGLLSEAGEFNPFNGVTDEICKVFIARQLEFRSLNPDATEEFEILALHPHEIDAMIQRGKIWDGMSLAAWILVRYRL
jgi:ADP-ribose pyrophosphatase